MERHMQKILTAMLVGSAFTLSALAVHAGDEPAKKEEKKAGKKDEKKKEETPK
jgi:hypothetical protein